MSSSFRSLLCFTSVPHIGSSSTHVQMLHFSGVNEDCFYYCSERNNVVVLFGTLKVQSFMLTEVKDCDLLIVVTSSTFLKRKDMLRILRFSRSGFFWPFRCPSHTWAHIKYPSSLCVCTRVYKHTHTHHPNTRKNREIYKTKPLSLPLPKHSLPRQ